ncbi:hypothetical protein D3C81_1994740 [compost metagenome]
MNSPDHLDTTTVATLLPMVLQVAMAIDMKRYTPNSKAKPSTGSTPIAVTVAANTTKLPPDTAAAPLDVTSMIAMVPSCCSQLIGTP